jgi:protein tyrosine phosphatase (PTP) superfamily phosphohydrolase (DUF442 family)
VTELNQTYVPSDAGVIEWNSWSGISYTCIPCYERTLTASATTVMTRQVDRAEVPVGTRCAMCEEPLFGRKHVG